MDISGYNEAYKSTTLRMFQGGKKIELFWNGNNVEVTAGGRNMGVLAGKEGPKGDTYIPTQAWASDDTGTGWSLTPNDSLKYSAFIPWLLTNPTPPTSGDYAGAKWQRTGGTDGLNGTGVSVDTNITEGSNNAARSGAVDIIKKAINTRLLNDFDAFAFIGKTIYDNTGIMAESASKKSCFCVATGGEIIELISTPSNVIHFYDKNFIWISNAGIAKKFTMPVNARYFGFANDLGNTTELILNIPSNIARGVENVVNAAIATSEDSSGFYNRGSINYNKISDCEYQQLIDTNQSSGNFTRTYGTSSDSRFQNSVLLTPQISGQFGYYFKQLTGIIYANGDIIHSGFFIKIISTNNTESIRIYNSITEESLYDFPQIDVETNKWVKVERKNTVIDHTIISGQASRVGILVDVISAGVSSIEITGHWFYQNEPVQGYFPYNSQSDNDASARLVAQNAYGNNIGRFLSKLWLLDHSYGDIEYSDKVKIAVIGDSIAPSIIACVEELMSEKFPTVTKEYSHCSLGGFSANGMMAKVWEIINWGPDLVVYGEWESYSYNPFDRNYLETIIRLFRQYSKADIAIYAHSFRRESGLLLEAGDIDGYLDSLSHKVRTSYVALAKKYGCEFMDIQYQIIQNIINGDATSLYCADVVHPTALSVSMYKAEIAKHLCPYWGNEVVGKKGSSQQLSTIYLSTCDSINDINNDYVLAGNWINNGIALMSSSANDSIDITSDNCVGWIVTHHNYGINAGFELLIDDMPARSAIAQYATFPLPSNGSYFASLNKVIIVNDVLGSLDYRNYKVVVTALTRDGNGALIALSFNLVDVTGGGTIIGVGNGFTDNTFGVNDGYIKIPQYYAGARNFKDGGYDINYPESPNYITIGDEYSFAAKSTIKQSYTQVNGDYITAIDVAPLRRGTHKIKIKALAAGVKIHSITPIT